MIGGQKMAIKYGFFNSVDGDRLYNAEDIGRFLHGIVSSGVFADKPDSLQVLANGDLTVTVQAGRAMLDCHYLENDAPLTLTLSAGGTQDRVDAIIMRLDMSERTCSIYVKEGTPSAAPVRPSVLRLDNTKEWMLAWVYVPKQATAITQSGVYDMRGNTSVCGWVTGLIDQNVIGVPIPNEMSAGLIPTVNAEGTGYELLPPDTTLSFEKAPADAAAVGAALAAIAVESKEFPGCYYRMAGTEKEWLNPPMIAGVEYRTTERHSNFPVYVQCMNIGSLGTGAKKLELAGIDSFKKVIGLQVFCQNTNELGTFGMYEFPIIFPDSGAVGASAVISRNSDGVFLRTDTFGDYASYNAVAKIKYVK
jgi:hypothetical protein